VYLGFVIRDLTQLNQPPYQRMVLGYRLDAPVRINKIRAAVADVRHGNLLAQNKSRGKRGAAAGRFAHYRSLRFLYTVFHDFQQAFGLTAGIAGYKGCDNPADDVIGECARCSPAGQFAMLVSSHPIRDHENAEGEICSSVRQN
jgi:hypothetical protein